MSKRWSVRVVCLLLTVGVHQAAHGETLSSSLYPVQLHYPGAAHLALAQKVLALVEEAWTFQVKSLGFLPPPKDAGAYGSDEFDVFLQDDAVTKQYYAYAEPIGPAADRAWGYASRLVISTQLPSAVYPLVVAHEFHHAVQAGICKSGNNIGEAGAVYISGVEREGEGWMMGYFLGVNEFQAHPERSLDWQGEMGNFYPYGGALYLSFLDQVYGDAEPGHFIQRIWEALGKITDPGKTSTFYPSYPHYFDAIASLIDFDAAYKKFCRWRYFTGPSDDGRHLRNLSNWEGSDADEKLKSVALAADHSAESLPVTDATPQSLPMPYGAIYVRLALAGAKPDETVRVAFSGESAVRWSIQYVLLRDPGTPDEGELDVATDGKASLDLPVKDHRSVVLAFVNLGNGKYRPEGSGWNASSFSYSLTRVEAPVIDSVEPGTLVAGEKALLHVKGRNFPLDVPAAQISSPEVQVGAVRVVGPGELEAEISLSAEARKGVFDLTVTWKTATVVKSGALTVEEAPVAGGDGASPSGGCVVGGATRPTGVLWFMGPLILLGALVLARSGRGRRPNRLRCRRMGHSGLLALLLLLSPVSLGCGADQAEAPLDSGAIPEAGVGRDGVSAPERNAAPDQRPAQDGRGDAGPTSPFEICTPTKDCPLGKICMAIGDTTTRGYCVDECATPDAACAVPDTAKNGAFCTEAEYGEGTIKLCVWYCQLQGKKYSCPTAQDFECMAPDPEDPETKICLLSEPIPGTWVTVPGGSFTMGSPTTELCREPGATSEIGKETPHPVTLTHAFQMMASEVTQADFKQLMGINPSKNAACGSSCPVDEVSWHQAAAYSNALSKARSLAECYSCTGSAASTNCSEVPAYEGNKSYTCPGYRLPTEAEWEYAYRAGSTGALYNGPISSCDGSDPNAEPIAWYAKNSGNASHPVNQKQPNSWGLFDLAGNVYEWCHDGYQEDLGSGTATDPVSPLGVTERILRGGSYTSNAKRLRAGYRVHTVAAGQRYDVGFRCVRTLAL